MQLPIFITPSIVKGSLANIPGRMFVLYLVDELAWIVWYDYFAFHTNEQAAVVDNCYLAHFVPDYTGFPIWMLRWSHSVRSTCERTLLLWSWLGIVEFVRSFRLNSKYVHCRWPRLHMLAPLDESDNYHIHFDIVKAEIQRGLAVLLTSNPRVCLPRESGLM